MTGPAPAEPAPSVFSVDLEDWYQGLEIDADRWGGFEPRTEIGLRVVLDLLNEAGARATFFVLGYEAERRPDLIKLVTDRSHEIASHGYAHRLIYRQTPAEFREDVRRAKAVVEQITGRRVLGYRAPFFSITSASEWALEVLAEEGFAYDSSVFPVMNYRYGMPRASRDPGWRATAAGRPLFEIPLSTVSLRIPLLGRTINVPAGGGAYFRLYPYALTRRLMDALRAEGRGAVFYVHPWEYDPAHPRIRLPRCIQQLTHYVHLASTAPKTARLLRDHRFTTFADAYGSDLARGRPSLPE